MHAAAGLALFFLPATAATASPPATSVLSLSKAEALEVKIEQQAVQLALLYAAVGVDVVAGRGHNVR